VYEKILGLFKQLGGLDTRVDVESSFKVTHGQLLQDRFLLGVGRQEAQGNWDERITSICENVGMPDNLLVAFAQSLPEANHIYFGVEKGEQTLTFKAYLEFRDKIEAGHSRPLFSGFKWDTSAPSRQAVTQYAWFPSLPIPEMLERLRSTIDPRRHPELLDIVEGIVERTAEKIPHSDVQYLEVTEEGNPRQSFDIHIYKAGYPLEILQPFLLKAARHYAIPSERFRTLYERIKTQRFGHLAGGVDRENRDFMTVYYGVRHIDSSQLTSATIVSGGDGNDE
jgi:hypothetical protein